MRCSGGQGKKKRKEKKKKKKGKGSLVVGVNLCKNSLKWLAQEVMTTWRPKSARDGKREQKKRGRRRRLLTQTSREPYEPCEEEEDGRDWRSMKKNESRVWMTLFLTENPSNAHMVL